MEERRAFIEAIRRCDRPREAVYAEFGISRKTGLKWIGRANALGVKGLSELSRRPQRQPNKAPQESWEILAALRRKHPKRGAKKLLVQAKAAHPGVKFSGKTQVSQFFEREGLVRPRKRRAPASQYRHSIVGYVGPNSVWCMDFKGPMHGEGGAEPFTVSDGTSRLVLCIRKLQRKNTRYVKQALKELFARYGIPDSIVSDNGPPFWSPQGITALSAWLMQLGIRHNRIEPGKPQQNGRHERMHRTMEEEIEEATPTQGRFDAFVEEFNHFRPHEAIAMKTPAEVYFPSEKRYPRRLSDPAHIRPMFTEWLDGKGVLHWMGRAFFITTVLATRRVGIELVDEQLYKVWYGEICLTTISTKGKRPVAFRMKSKTSDSSTHAVERGYGAAALWTAEDACPQRLDNSLRELPTAPQPR